MHNIIIGQKIIIAEGMEVYFDEGTQFVEYFGIEGVPTYVVFGPGGEYWRYVGIQSYEDLINDMVYHTD